MINLNNLIVFFDRFQYFLLELRVNNYLDHTPFILGPDRLHNFVKGLLTRSDWVDCITSISVHGPYPPVLLFLQLMFDCEDPDNQVEGGDLQGPADGDSTHIS